MTNERKKELQWAIDQSRKRTKEVQQYLDYIQGLENVTLGNVINCAKFLKKLTELSHWLKCEFDI